MKTLGLRLALFSALLAGLVLAPTAAATPNVAQTYPLVAAYHFTGTPFAVAFVDGGTAGRIAVMYEFNLKGIVPNSYAAVITSLYDIEVRADKKRHLSAVSTFPRPDALARPAGLTRPELASPQPDLAQLPKLPIKNFTGEERKTFLRDDPTETSFIFFVNDTTGEEILASNPQKSGSATLIPHSTAFEFRLPSETIYPIPDDGHEHVETKQEVGQPPLTPNLDDALTFLEEAITLEAEASDAFQQNKGRKFTALLRKADHDVTQAKLAFTEAEYAGEASGKDEAIVSKVLGEAVFLADDHALNPLEVRPDLKNKPAKLRAFVLTQLKLAEIGKNLALARCAKAKAAREAGTGKA